MSAHVLSFFCLVPVISLAFEINGVVYDPDEARMFASLSSVTYCAGTEKILDWTCTSCTDSKTALVPGRIKIIEGGARNATRILVGKLRDQAGCVVAFRGSDNVENWVRDLEVWRIVPSSFEDCDGCMVHTGFYDIWKNVRGSVMTALNNVGCSPASHADNVLYITGHSLGAALTHLAMFTLDEAGFHIAKSYSFEAPRTGNKAFSDAFTQRFTRRFPVFRVTHHMDPVPHLPLEIMGYTHVQTEVYYNGAGGYKLCPQVEDKSCADQFWDVAGLAVFHSGDHCGSSLVPNGDICDPIGCRKDDSIIV